MPVLLMLAACGSVPAVSEPADAPALAHEPLIDIGLFGGRPALPPDFGMEELPGGTAVIVVDRGNRHQVRRIQHDGERWRSLGGFDAPLIPAGERGPALARLEVGPDDGFEDPLLLLVGRIPNGPVQQLELTLDGETTRVPTSQPVTVIVLRDDAAVGDHYTTLDSGTHRFDVLPLLHPEQP